MPLEINLGLSALATGTVDAITATYSPAPTLVDKKILFLRTIGTNTVVAPTFSPNGLTAHTITKNNGTALAIGDMDGVVVLMYDLPNTRWELLTPKGVSTIAVNPTSAFLPYNNAGIFADSHLSQDATNVIVNGKDIKGSGSVANISFNNLAGAQSVGLFAQVVSPFAKGWSYVTALSSYIGFTAAHYFGIDASASTLKHGTKVVLDAPNVTLFQETDSLILSTDASKNIKGLPTTTYPSLTELSYVKGSTSGIQTQINSLDSRKDVSSFQHIGSTNYSGWYGSFIACSNPTIVSTLKDLLIVTPFILSSTKTIDEIVCEVTVAGTAGSVIRMGIYSDNGNVFPGALLIDAGTVAGDTVAVKTIVINQVMQPGLYWLAFFHNSFANITVRALSATAGVTPSVMGIVKTSITNAQLNRIAATLTYTTLPANFPTTSIAFTNSTIPMVLVHTSA